MHPRIPKNGLYYLCAQLATLAPTTLGLSEGGVPVNKAPVGDEGIEKDHVCASYRKVPLHTLLFTLDIFHSGKRILSPGM